MVKRMRPGGSRGTRAGLSQVPRLLAVGVFCASTGWSVAEPASELATPRAPIGSDRPPAGAMQALPPAEPGHAFYFTRAVYSGGRGYRDRGAWATDFPKADEQFLFVLGRMLPMLDLYRGPHPVRLDDPELRRFPFLYVLEVGYMNLTEAEVEGLRGYLQAGGFLLVDDFWGTRQWENFEREMARVLPGRPIVEIPLDHPLFRQFYSIEEVIQVPAYSNARWGGPTYEQDGYVPHVRGIFDEDGNLMVVINWNTDLGDAWEWSEQPDYPIEYSNFAYEMAINLITYAMTH